MPSYISKERYLHIINRADREKFIKYNLGVAFMMKKFFHTINFFTLILILLLVNSSNVMSKWREH